MASNNKSPGAVGVRHLPLTELTCTKLKYAVDLVPIEAGVEICKTIVEKCMGRGHAGYKDLP